LTRRITPRYPSSFEQNHPLKDLVGEFRCINTPDCIYESDKDDQEGMLKAREFPLAKLSGTFSNIRVVLSDDMDDWKRLGGSKAMSINVIRGQLNELCTDHSSANPESA